MTWMVVQIRKLGSLLDCTPTGDFAVGGDVRIALEAEQLDECHWLYRHSMVLFLIQPLAGEMQTHDM